MDNVLRWRVGDKVRFLSYKEWIKQTDNGISNTTMRKMADEKATISNIPNDSFKGKQIYHICESNRNWIATDFISDNNVTDMVLSVLKGKE